MVDSSDDRELKRLREEISRHGMVLSERETKWRDREELLLKHGYELRPRFRRDWVPSWVGRDVDPICCEDFHSITTATSIDAKRSMDGERVYLKEVATNGDELAITLKFSEETLQQDPRNHCVPVLDHFRDDKDPAISYIVLPVLHDIDEPPFEDINQITDFVDQILEGLCFIHENNVAHRDCSPANIMMDAEALYPHSYHPVRQLFLPDRLELAPHLPRSAAPVKYYFIDFGLSVYIPPSVSPKLVQGRYGRDRDPPELEGDEPYDPFKLDVFIIGNMFRKMFVEMYTNAAFLEPLIKSMTAITPADRPSAQEAYSHWDTIRQGLSPWKKLQRLRRRKAVWLEDLILDMVFPVQLCIRLSRHVYSHVMRVFSALFRSFRCL